MNLQKIIYFIKSTIGLILFGFYKKSDVIPFFNKKVTIEDYKLFLKRTTTNSWDELLKPSFVEGVSDALTNSNFKITSDLNFDDKFPITLKQKKEEFQYWIDFEKKDGVIKFINISTGDNSNLVMFNIILTSIFFYTYFYFEFHFLLFISFVALIRLYTIMTINKSISLIKTHLMYLFEIYSRGLVTN